MPQSLSPLQTLTRVCLFKIQIEYINYLATVIITPNERWATCLIWVMITFFDR